jgi:hypothetical protein
MPSFFLAIAVLLNVNKWIYFELRIFAFIGVGKLASEQMVEKEQRLLRYSQQLQQEAARRSPSGEARTIGAPNYEYADIEPEIIDVGSSRNGSDLSDPGEIIDKQMKKMNDWVKIANGILIACAVTYSIVVWFFITSACVRNDIDKYLQRINEVTSYMFCFLGIVFLTVGVIMNCSLSNHFPDFYANYKCLLWTATILLTCPLFIRSAKDYAYYHSSKF